MGSNQGKEAVAKLSKYFETNQAIFLGSSVKEAHVRQSLIDPLLEALGWDVRNSAHIAPQYREVIPEDSLEIDGQQKAPDYTFRIGTLPKFFVEAKKCAVNIDEHSGPAFQLRRYGWSAKVSLSILTNFQALAVYDCGFKPGLNDKPSRGRLMYFGFEEYVDRWGELWDIFSRESVWGGSFDNYAASKRKRGTSEVDAEFLSDIEHWREALAKNMALRNLTLSSNDLNAAVQSTIDRIVFLRMAEDRGLEPYQQLMKLCERPSIYRRFMLELCRRADDKYNSGLFHFHNERGVLEKPDGLTPSLTVDDKIFKPILQSLYFSHGSPYDFRVMPVEVLGTVYERFLGKVIRLTAGHQAKVEEKPEVRKAGGVYYTPATIVEHIVNQTVGRCIAKMSPLQLRGSVGAPPFRVLDMACGSGSFLIGAYQHLLNHYLAWYIDHKPETQKNAVYQDPSKKEWRLTISERKRILTTHIFGVDIDAQAVEVSKLSLLLKALEGESDASLALQRQLKLFEERALPNLTNNVKWGNSLVGPDYRATILLPDEDELERLNPFDWRSSFSDAIKAGGFDCVIGNPPWISLSGKFGNDICSQTTIKYLTARYGGNTYMPNMYEYFVAQGLSMTRTNGYFGYIVPDRLGFNSQFVHLRRRMLTEATIDSLIYKMPFPGITADTLVFVCSINAPPSDHRVQISEFRKHPISIPQTDLFNDPTHTFKYFQDIETMKLVAKIESRRGVSPLESWCSTTSGFGGKSALIEDTQSSQQQIRTIKGDSIGRYQMHRVYWFDFRKENITGRTTDRRKLGASPKILLRKTGDRIIATYDDSGVFPEQSLYFLYDKRADEDYKYLLGLLNSRLVNFYFNAKLLTNKDSIAQVKKVDLDKIPLQHIELTKTDEKEKHDQIVRHVDSMLTLQRRAYRANSDAQKDIIQRQIATIDTEIDNTVYALYELSAEEIALIECKGDSI